MTIPLTKISVRVSLVTMRRHRMPHGADAARAADREAGALGV